MSPVKKPKEGHAPESKSGVYIFPNGDKYEGEYFQLADGVLERNGVGTHTSSNGTTYQGQWMNDKMHGVGRIQFSGGASYEGNFKENKFHGSGHYTWPNGSFFDGSFVENKMEGEGNFTDTDGQVWSGNFWYKAAPGLRYKLNL